MAGAEYHLVGVLAQEGFTAGEGDVQRSAPHFSKDAVPLFDGQVVVGFAPHVAGFALGVAAEANADHDAEGQHARPAKTAKSPVKGKFW